MISTNYGPQQIILEIPVFGFKKKIRSPEKTQKPDSSDSFAEGHDLLKSFAFPEHTAFPVTSGQTGRVVANHQFLAGIMGNTSRSLNRANP